MAEHFLAQRGTLWAWTTQDFPPPSPPFAGAGGKAFVPFGIGYIDLRRREGRDRVSPRRTPKSFAGGHGHGARRRAVPHQQRRQRGRDVRVPAGRVRSIHDSWMFAVIGVGLHPFGRFGDTTAIDMGGGCDPGPRLPTPASSGGRSRSRSAAATRSTTPMRWSRSWASPVSRSPTSTTAAPTAASALFAGGADRIRTGEYDIGIAVGHGQAPARRVHRRPPVCMRARRGTASSVTSSRRSSSA